MEILVLGGSVFLGAETARAAIAAGHDVTCFTRGRTGEVPAGAAHVVGDRDEPDGLAAVTDQTWDAVVDVSRHPGQVRRAVAELRTEHYLFVSTGSVYADTATAGLTEDGPLLPALDADVMETMEAYGPAKVACERAALDVAALATVVRPGLIGGRGDASGRSGYWPWRLAHPSGDAVLLPHAPDLMVQLIDVVDLAAWLVHLLTEQIGGVFNAVGDPVTFPDAIAAARPQAQPRTSEPRLVAAEAAWLLAHDVNPWAGPRSLPLWLDDPEWAGFGSRSNAAAKAAGLTLRPLAETFVETLRWHEQDAGVPRSGLSDAEELDLLALLAAEVPGS